MALKFQDPPNGSRIGSWSYDWTAVFGELKQNPGRWALLNEDGPAKASLANAIKQGSILAMQPSAGIRVRIANTNRHVSPRTCDIYLQYDPEADESLTPAERRRIVREIKDRERENL